MAGSVLAIPLLAGILGLVVLRDPKVRAGFEEVEGALDGDDDDELEADDDDEEDDEEEDDEDERPRRKARR